MSVLVNSAYIVHEYLLFADLQFPRSLPTEEIANG